MINRNRTFIFPLLDYIESDVTQIPKIREIYQAGDFTIAEYAYICWSIVMNAKSDAIDDEGSRFYEEYRVAGDLWSEASAKFENVDYERGISQEWDDADIALELMHRHIEAVFLEEAGEPEMAHLVRDHFEAWRALVDQGGESLSNDPEVLNESYKFHEDDYTIVAAKFDKIGQIQAWYPNSRR